MVLDDLVEPKKIKDPRGIPPGSNLFEWRSSASKELTRKMAKKNLFTNNLVLTLLNLDKYRKEDYIPKHQLQTRKQIIEMGVNSSDIKKRNEKGIDRFYLTEQAVLSVVKHYYGKGRINDYNKKDILKDLKDLVY